MMKAQENLDQYVQRVLKEKGLSPSAVEQRSGGRISDSYIYSILSGNIGSLTVAKLKALALGLGVAEDEVFAAARGLAPEDEPDFQGSHFASLYRKYSDLSNEDKREVQILVEVLNHEIERRQARARNEKRSLNESMVA